MMAVRYSAEEKRKICSTWINNSREGEAMRRGKEPTGIIETRRQREHNYEAAKFKSVEWTTKQEVKI